MDRLLEYTGAVRKRGTRPIIRQYGLERKRDYIKSHAIQWSGELNGEQYVLNLIDTPAVWIFPEVSALSRLARGLY